MPKALIALELDEATYLALEIIAHKLGLLVEDLVLEALMDYMTKYGIL
jgi:hypothetical protein